MKTFLGMLLSSLLRSLRRRAISNQTGTLDLECAENYPGGGSVPDEAPIGANAQIKALDSSEMPRVRRYGDES